jgi:hypothetical protein
LKRNVVAAALILHQMPDDIWNRMDYDDLLLLSDVNAEAHGLSHTMPMDDLDRDLIAELKAQSSPALASVAP